MSFIGELDLRNLTRNSIHFHDKPFNVFGLTIDGLGHTGITENCLGKKGKEKRIPNKLHVYHEDGKIIHQVGEILLNLRHLGHDYEVLDVAPLDKEDHAITGYENPNMQSGTAYLLKPVTPSAA